MADFFSILEDVRCYNFNTDCSKVIYHANLNTFLVITKKNEILVIDVNSSSLLHKASYEFNGSDKGLLSQIDGISMNNKILLNNGECIGLRGDYNGILLLDTIFQQPVSDDVDVVEIDLPISEVAELMFAVGLCKSFDTNVIMGYLGEALDSAMCKPGFKDGVVEKWNIVKLKIPFVILMHAMYNTVNELRLNTKYVQGFSISSSITARLHSLFEHSLPSMESTMMANELKRSKTFSKWTGLNFQCASPDQLARAGFYYKSLADGDEGAICFACGMVLSCWEATEEQFAEHAKHAVDCPYISGEYTDNVPMSTVFATAEPIKVSNQNIGTTCVSDIIPLFSSDTVTVYETSKLLKPEVVINLSTSLSSVNLDDSNKSIQQAEEQPNNSSDIQNSHDQVYSSNGKKVYVTACSALGPSWFLDYLSELPSYEKKTNIHVGKSEIDRMPFDKLKKVMPSVVVGIREVSEPEQPSPDGLKKSSELAVGRARVALVVYDIQYKQFENVKINNLANMFQNIDWKDNEGGKTKKISSGTTASSTNEKESYMSLTSELMDNYMDTDVESSSAPSELHDQSFQYDYDISETTSSVSFSNATADNLDGMLLISGLVSTSPDKTAKTSFKPNDNLAEASGSQFDLCADLEPSKNAKLIGVISLEACISDADFIVSGIYPATTGYHLLVILKRINDTVKSTIQCSGVMVLYRLKFDNTLVTLESNPLCIKYLKDANDLPVDVTMLPVLQKFGGDVYKKGTHIPRAAVITSGGELKVWNLLTYDVIASWKSVEKFVSVTYCTSVEKLCVLSEHGKLHYFSLLQKNADLLYEEFGLHRSKFTDFALDGKIEQTTPESLPLISSKVNFTKNDLKMLVELTKFENVTPRFTADTLSCWSEVKQGQKQRKQQPQSLLRNGDANHTRSWKLQLGPSTWSHHLIGISLPHWVYVGHVKLKFTLRSRFYKPNVQVSLLKKRDPSEVFTDISEPNAERDAVLYSDRNVNPVLTPEFHRVHNTELLCGPINLKSCLDVTERAGCVKLTSPYLFRDKCRIIIVHLRSLEEKRLYSSPLDDVSLSDSSNKQFFGCDNIAEISITVRKSKEVDIVNEKSERCNMLESNLFFENMLKCYFENTDYQYRQMALDILIWAAYIRLSRCRMLTFNCITDQLNLIYTVESYLNEIIRTGFINGDRSAAHKTVKLLTVVCEGCKTVKEDQPNQFEIILMNKLIEWLPQVLKCWSAGALRWFFYMLTNVASLDSKGFMLYQCFSLLMSISKELHKRKNRYHLILRSRFGLYGCPFDAELFDADLAMPGGYTNFIWLINNDNNAGNKNGPPQLFIPLSDGGTFWNGFTQKTINLKDLISKGCTSTSGNKNDISVADNVSANHFMKGLMEVELLQFTCHSASDNTKIERSQIGLSANRIKNDDMFSSVNMYFPSSSSPDNNYVSTLKKIPDKEKKPFDLKTEFPNILPDEMYHHLQSTVFSKLKESAPSLMNSNFAKKLIYVSKYQMPTNQSGSTQGQLAIPPALYLPTAPIPLIQPTSFLTMLPSSPSVAGPSTQPSLASVVYPTKLIYSDFSEENSDSSFPWQELFNVPYSTIIFAEKMRSSDKRHVVLDFGHPVILTDVIFPPYSEIVSLTISVWLNDESDATCLAISTDINSRVLILSDIQPPPLCQYVKISIVGLFINNSSRCRIPIGCFYGHIYTSPDDFYFEQPTKSVKSKYSLRNLSVLERMIQDLRCKYESSCSKLKNCLTPLLLNNEPNTAHMKYYLNKMKSVDDTPEITPRVTNLYHESMTYRQQLNFLISFMKRITNTMVDPLLDQTCSLELMIGYAATSKLKLIIELLLEISLYMTHKLSIRFKEAGILYEAFNEHQISDLFNNLCIGEDPRIQLSTATLLVRLFGNCLWWSDFIVESFSFHFSSDCLKIFPRERVFALYSHLVRKSILMTGNQIHLIEHILKILLKNLAPLSQPNNLTGFLRSALDMELISWILLLLIQCVEVLPSENDTENKEPDATARWNFVYKETPIQRKKGGLERKNALRNLKKYHKKLCSSEPDKIEDFLFIADAIKETSDLLNSSTPALMKYATTTNADDVPPKKKVVGLLPPDPLQLYKQMKGIYLNSRSSGSQMNTAEDNTKGNKLRIRKQYALSVARALIAFVLHADNTCNVDMVVAVFKVLSLVIRLSASRIGMYEIIDQKQLLKLIQISTWCENARPVVGGKWISHCITCFLADFVDRVRKKFTPVPSTSSSQVTKATIIVQEDLPSGLVSTMAASLQTKKPLLSDLLWFKPPKLNPAANNNDTGNSSQLPSLLESDDSDDMEEAFDDLIHFTNQPFEIIKETNINKYPTYPSIISVAMDFRLDLKVEEQLSVIIKRNLDLTANVLGQSVASLSPLTVSQRSSSLFMCGTENLALPWIIGFTVTTESTLDMLTTAFNEFLCNLNMTGTINHLEELLHMWLILCSTDLASDYSKQLPPCIPLSAASVSKIISFAVSYTEISVTLWDIMFRTLTLASFLPEKPEAADSQDATKLAGFIIEHNDFSTMITSFLSKRVSGNAVGESVTKSFRDMLVQLMNYCSLNGNINRKLDSKLKKLFIEILHHLMSPVGPIAHKRGPCDAQYVFIRTLLDVDSYEYIDLSRTPGIVVVLGGLLVSQVKETHLLKCCNVTNPVHMPSTYFDEQQFNTNSTTNSTEKISSYYPPTRSYLLINIIKLVIKMTRLPHSFLYYAGSNDDNSPTDNSAVTNNTSNKKKQYLIELILGNELAVYQLLAALSYCYTPVSDEINFQTEFFIDSAVFDKSIGDAIYNLMLYFIERATNVDLILKPLMQFLSSKCNEYYSDGLVMQLSDPLMRVITKVLSTCSIIIKFIDYGGMNIISQNLQRCFSIVMNQNHSTVSSMMQYLYGPHAFNFPLVNNRTQKKYFIERTENGLINFAPLGVITCNSMSTTSPDVLLMPGVNRRTRSPTWSYNFQTGEKSVVLKIVLPCAFLLKEVHVHPHYLSPAFPAYISIEISRNGKDYVSVDVPTETGRLAFVHVALQQPEIVLGVQLRFYKPKDMHNIGLSQICLLGYSVFGDVKSYCDPEMLNEEKLLRISIMWLNVLHHCLSREPHNSAFNKKIVSCIDQDTVDTVCGFICLPSPWPTNLVKMFQYVLISFCNFSEILGGRIIQLLLQNGCRQQLKYGKKIEPVIASNNALLILDTVCNPQDSTCTDRIEIALNWLDKACEFCLQNKSIESITPPYVYFISTILWKVKDHDHAYKLPRIGQSIFKKLLVLSSYLPTIYSLKSVVDKTICSFCFVKPSFYLQFLEYIGVVVPDDDGSPTQVNSNTDVETDLYDDDIQVNSSTVNSQYKLKDKSEIRLSEKDFITLSSASISSPAVRILMSTKFLYTLIQTISEFCKNECSYAEFLDTIATTDADRVNIYIPGVSVKLPLLHVNNICAILDFLSELCWDGFIRDWLGSPEVRSFWTDILLFMCQRDEMNNFKRKKFPSELVLKLEDAVIKFFCRACWCYPENQKSVVQIICKTSFNPVNWDAVASECKDGLNNFTRKLLLELILNDEKIFVAVSMEHIYDEFELRQSPGTTIYPSHPSLPCTNHQQLLYVGVDTTCSDIAKLVMTPWRDSEIYDEDKSNLDDNREYRLINDMGENCGMAVAAGFTAKDKRYKIKSLTQSAENPKNSKEHSVMVDEFFEYNTGSISQSGKVKFRVLRHAILEPQQYFSPDVSLRCILNLMRKKGNGLGTPLIKLTVALKIIQPDCFEQGVTLTDPLPSLMEDFTQNGGIELIAHNIPVVCQTPVQASSALLTTRKESDSVWKKFDDFENNFFDLTDDVWDDKLDKIEKPEKSDKTGESSTPSSAAGNKMVQLENSIISVIPPHSLIAFGQFMKLPNYGAALIKDRKTAICLLRLAIGGNLDINEVINTNPELLNSLSTLPFETMGTVFKTIPLTTDHGSALRRYALHVGAIHIIFACLAVFTHHPEKIDFDGPNSKYSWLLNIIKQYYSNMNIQRNEEKSNTYWAKGTGFGTGSTAQSWNVEQALNRQKLEEKHVIVFLQVLSYYINSDEVLQENPEEYYTKIMPTIREENDRMINHYELPLAFTDLLSKSCLIQSLSSYVHNDSVLDVSRHVPLYLTILSLLRAMAVNPDLAKFLIPRNNRMAVGEEHVSLIQLLQKLKSCIETYSSKLKLNIKQSKKKAVSKPQENAAADSNENSENIEDEGLARLIPDVLFTTKIVEEMTSGLLQAANNSLEHSVDADVMLDNLSTVSIEEQYINTMRPLQFDSYDIIAEVGDGAGIKFNVSYHFEMNLKSDAGKFFPARMKRLAQEATTLSTSLPLSYSSSVFVRCDTERLDVMKVLITGPAETPYANGCFEFDVYFPPDYPKTPMLINLETTGRHTVRFNPNLYNDGKVCLSILNTWHGRPEEKWNPQTSSFLQVLVSIQSLILVPEPYFNEPGYERSRGTAGGNQSSRDYNSNILQANVKWAMLNQIRNPSPCFKQIIQTHFWFKRQEIVDQITSWITELESDVQNKRIGKNMRASTTTMKCNLKLLCDEFERLSPPSGLEHLSSISEFQFKAPDSKFLNTSSSSSSSKTTTATDPQLLPTTVKMLLEAFPIAEEEYSAKPKNDNNGNIGSNNDSDTETTGNANNVESAGTWSQEDPETYSETEKSV